MDNETTINMDEVVEHVQRLGHFAYVEQTGGGCATIYAGVFEPEADEQQYEVLAGPGWFEAAGWTQARGRYGDFYVGIAGDDDNPTTILEGITEREIAVIIMARLESVGQGRIDFQREPGGDIEEVWVTDLEPAWYVRKAPKVNEYGHMQKSLWLGTYPDQESAERDTEDDDRVVQVEELKTA